MREMSEDFGYTMAVRCQRCDWFVETDPYSDADDLVTDMKTLAAEHYRRRHASSPPPEEGR
jgi:hypothetical protein